MIRPYTNEDYNLVASWWEKRGFPKIPAHLLPTNGVIVEERAVGFLYSTDSGIAWLEWIVSDPDQRGETDAVSVVIETLVQAAKQLGFSVVFSSLHNERLINKYTKAGFDVGDVGMTNMSMVL